MTTIRSLPAYALSRSAGRTQARSVFGYALVDTSGKLPRPAGDTDYRKPEQTLLKELIVQANPDAFTNIDPNQIAYEAPVALPYTRGDESNTTIVAKAAPNALDVVGRQTLRYRRIDLSKLFRYQTIELTRYSNVNTLPWAEVQELLLKQHGINVSSSTFTPVTLNVNATTTLTALATSQCYIGAIAVVWRKGRREISEMFSTATLDGRAWPEGLIQFGDTYKPQGEYIAYDFDFTDLMGTSFNSWGNNTLTSGQAELDKLAAVLNTVAPQYNWNSLDYSVDNVGGLKNLLFNRYAIPNAAVPEANSGLFNRVAVLAPTIGDAWFYGKLLFHYKV
jgi:hypothetical protein